MRVTRQQLRGLGRTGLILLNVAVALVLLATGALLYLESGWARPTFREPSEAFWSGSIGTEVVPLPAAIAFPILAPQHFQPAGPDGGDWIEQFGFLRNPDDPNGLPVGLTVSNYRPQTGAPSPVPFVGFACAMCHTTGIQTSEGEEPRIISGPGSVSLNIFAYVDALQAAIVERQPPANGGMPDRNDPPPYLLTADQLIEAYEAETGKPVETQGRLMTRLWLSQARKRIEEAMPRYGEPYGHGRSRDEIVTPTGPTRTQPFRVLIRSLVHRPGTDMKVFSKMATVFSQDLRPRAQFDGSIADIASRSAFAALAQGATAVNLAQDEIAHNIAAASAYTVDLRAPAFTEMFPDQPVPDPSALARGKEVYQTHCFGCHGDRTADGGWSDGPRTNTIIPLAEIGTDPERVTFRYYEELAGLVHAHFGPRHPFAFDRNDIFPLPGEEGDFEARGYLAGPLDGLFLRAPYLHNASVLTLAELINLEPRRDVFYRGRNLYDTARVGFASPRAPDAERYFTYNTATVGNANTGHNYPWAGDDPARSETDLRDLLEYLKTL
jgi:mono/diheme cytochrome c family protein